MSEMPKTLPNQSSAERSEQISKPLSPEELRIQNDVQAKLIKHSKLKDDPMKWIDRYGGAFGVIFDGDSERFVKIYQENPEALYEIFLPIFQNAEESDAPDHS